MSLQQRVKQLIAEHGTLRAAARAVSVDVSYLSRLEHGEKFNPSEDILARMGLVRVVTYRRVAK
jgi:transcriptional regulator with XRE-family HTH domain